MQDQKQMMAINHQDGPCMVLAGPGSGKTTVITYRTRNLIEQLHVDPRHILVITFTRAAALSMKQRFQTLMNQNSIPVLFGTFHSVFFMMLKNAYHYTGENVFREEERFQLMRELIQRHRLEYADETEFIQDLLGEVGKVKNLGIPIANYFAENCSASEFRDIFREYEEEKSRRRKIDFDDMLVYTKELLEQRPDILQGWRNRFSYILIDEFQDINPVQYEIIKLLAYPKNNLFVVGDDDQSIYSFRGAAPALMQRFAADYPKCRQVVLGTNYRCKQEIVKASDQLIQWNRGRFEKELRAQQEGGNLTYQLFPDEKKEYKQVLRWIHEEVEKGVPYEEIAVLFRTNKEPMHFVEELMRDNIPFHSRDMIPNLYEHFLAKDMFAYMNLAAGSRRRQDLLRIMNRPKRYISREVLDEPEFAFDVLEMYFEDKPWVLKRITELEQKLRTIRSLKPYSAITYIRKSVRYDEFLEEYADYRHISYEDLMDTLDEIQDSAKEFQTYEDWLDAIAEFTEELNRQKEEMRKIPNAVTISTLHSAKGLEFQTVFILDVYEGSMPYKKAILEEDLEEERRMFYVGMTRAKESLYLCGLREKNNHLVEESPYVKEMRQLPEKDGV